MARSRAIDGSSPSPATAGARRTSHPSSPPAPAGAGLPLHYTPVGEVHNSLPDKGVVIVELTEGRAVAVGERLGFVGPVEFAEEEISSIQFEDEQRQVSPEAGRIGLKTALTKDELRKGTPVFLVGPGYHRPRPAPARAPAGRAPTQACPDSLLEGSLSVR